jgi:hypothetical protein
VGFVLSWPLELAHADGRPLAACDGGQGPDILIWYRRIAMPPDSVHFNGSVNLPDTETVMREISSRIPRGVRRMTDGETGERLGWIDFQVQKFAAMPEFQPAGTQELSDADLLYMPPLHLADAVAADDVRWPDLGYAAAYTDSYQVFRRLQDGATIPPGVRFQMQYPTPTAPVAGNFVPEGQDRLVASYQAALFADLDRALARLPHEQIAVQWDVAVEFEMLEGCCGFARTALGQITPGLARCADQVPGDVPVGMHLCYGDAGHQHFKQPDSLALQVQVANAVTSAAHRPVNWFSFTVPQAQRDSDYFAPLADLGAGPETELYFALVPYYPARQAADTTAQQVAHIDTHLARSPAGSRDWGICTECGMGRAQADDVPALLDLHRAILDSHGDNR